MLHIQLVQSPVVLVEQKAVQFAVTELNEKVLAIDRRQPVEQIENRGVGGEIAEHLEQILCIWRRNCILQNLSCSRHESGSGCLLVFLRSKLGLAAFLVAIVETGVRGAFEKHFDCSFRIIREQDLLDSLDVLWNLIEGNLVKNEFELFRSEGPLILRSIMNRCQKTAFEEESFARKEIASAIFLDGRAGSLKRLVVLTRGQVKTLNDLKDQFTHIANRLLSRHTDSQ